MDNGAFMKYRNENPVVNTFISKYENISPEQFTNEEIVVLAVFGFLAVYVLVKLFIKIFKHKE
jgi:hypothetical protein